MPLNLRAAIMLVVFGLASVPLHAQLVSPQVGWQATLSRLAHNVSGTVVIVDEDTLRVDNFTYDGGGLSVYFYLGTEESRPAFAAGLSIGPQLFGHPYTGGEPPLVIDLPAGETLEGWHAITVWCVDVGVSFGQGTFAPVPISGDYNNNGVIDAADYVLWRNNEGMTNVLPNDPLGGTIGAAQYNQWRTNFGRTPASASGATGSVSAFAAVPEPASIILLALGLLIRPLLIGRPRRSPNFQPLCQNHCYPGGPQL